MGIVSYICALRSASYFQLPTSPGNILSCKASADEGAVVIATAATVAAMINVDLLLKKVADILLDSCHKVVLYYYQLYLTMCMSMKLRYYRSSKLIKAFLHSSKIGVLGMKLNSPSA